MAELVDLKIGDRLQLSALGSERCPRLAGKIGTVKGFIQHSNTISVHFDGNKSSTSIHRNYIELIQS
ncbi:hypothetical protein ACFIOY_36455 [Bradyrhizobium sp. TZ2]